MHLPPEPNLLTPAAGIVTHLSLEGSLVHVGMPIPFVLHRRGKPWYLITLMCKVI